MAVTAKASHFLVLFCLLSASFVKVRAIEEFVGTCGFTLDLMISQKQSGILNVPMPESFTKYQDPRRPNSCEIIITFTHGMHLLIELYRLDIIPLSSDRKACPTGLEVIDNTGRNHYGGRICMEAWEWEERHRENKQEKRVVESSPLTFRLTSEGPYKGDGFKVHFNLFRPYWPCYAREYKCEQIQRCVHDDLTCDGWDDCGDYSDEKEEAGCGLLTASEICAIIIGALLIIGTVISSVLYTVTFKRLEGEFGLRSESKIPIANETKMSMDPIMNWRYNSQESMSKFSRSTAPTTMKDDFVDKAMLDRLDRLSSRTPDNLSERSYRSNPRRNIPTAPPSEPISKSGQYSYRGRNSSQSSLNRDKGEPVNGIDNKGMGRESADRSSDKRSHSRERRHDRDSEDRYDDRRNRRRSHDRDYRRDDRYSDEDSDYERDRDRRRRRRSYDRYSDDSDFERDRDRRRSRRSYDSYSDDSEEYERERERRRRSRERRSRDRYDSRERANRDQAPNGETNPDADLDRPPRRRDSRERDRDRYGDPFDDDRYRGRSPDRDSDEDRRYRSSRRRSGERRRDPYDDDDYRRPRPRGPSSERDRMNGPPSALDDRRSHSRENVDKSESEASLPPPPSGEEIRKMEIEKQRAVPPVVPPAEKAALPTVEAPKAPPTVEKPRPPPSMDRKPPPMMEKQRAPPTMEKPRTPPTMQKPTAPADDRTRIRSTDDRRERYSRNRWRPKSRDSPPPEYEDVSPTKHISGAEYREETV